jgi:predicted phage terminase large subunit-like protein
MPTNDIPIKVPRKMLPFFGSPRGEVRYRACYGGRGGGRSFNFATLALLMGCYEPLRILCCRQFQNSISESFLAELKATLSALPELAKFYEVGERYITGRNGTEFIFKGLERNIGAVKSLSNIDICILEEAQDVKEDAWLVLEPTIRKDKSEIWGLWNPTFEDAPVEKRLRNAPPSEAVVIEMCFWDNEFFPDVLEKLRLRDQSLLSPQMYEHIWEGKYITGDMGEVFKWDWFGTHQYIEPYHGFERIVCSWDTAYKADEHNDPSACTVWGIKENKAYLVHVLNERMEYPQLKRSVIELAQRFTYTAPPTILIEDKASGQSLLQELRQESSLPVIAINPVGDKITRASSCTGAIEAGRVLVPHNADWLPEYKKQLIRFSFNKDLLKSQHDDMVDSTSQFINWWGAGSGVELDIMRQYYGY